MNFQRITLFFLRDIPRDILRDIIIQIWHLTIVEMTKAYDLNLYEYLKFLLKHRPNENMTDEELDYLAPWSIDVLE